MKNDDILTKAKKRVNQKKGFYWHLASFIITGLFFFAMNMAINPSEIRFFIPLIPWSVGLFFHYVGVFGIPFLNVLGEDWEKRQLEKEIMDLQEKRREQEHLLLLEKEEDMMNINEHDYRQMKKMRENYRE
jgi:hypothetical protein